MNLHQLKFLQETVRQGLSLTNAARVMNTSQPGVSKAIIELEHELGIKIFERHGKRIIDLTEPGREVMVSVEKIMTEVDNMRKVSQEFVKFSQGRLRIAATHTQARYILPTIIQQFCKEFPDVHLSILQGDPAHLADMVLHDQADLAIATESLLGVVGLNTIPAYDWSHAVIAPNAHPIFNTDITLEQLAQYPIITYIKGFAGRKKIEDAFITAGLSANILLEAIDADVIKAYVEKGMGIGIIAEAAFNPIRDVGYRIQSVGHLFGTNTARIAVRKNAYLRGYALRFIELLAPQGDLQNLISGSTNEA
jgi:LysR family cys regulon transcriptional activator